MSNLSDFRLVRPTSLADAVAILEGTPNSRPVAGATDLLPNLRRGIGESCTLVDMTAVTELATLDATNSELRIGGGVMLADLADHPGVRTHWPVVAEAAGAIAGPTHRAAATVGGNLCQDTRCVFYNQSEWWRQSNGWCLKLKGEVCHVVKKSDRCYAAYAGDLAPVFMVLGAEVEVAGPQGRRRLPVGELFREEGSTHLVLDPGEIVACVVVPRPRPGQAAGYAKVRVRDAVDFPLAGIAIALRRDGNILAELRAAVTGVASAPQEVPGLDTLTGRPWSDQGAGVLAEAVRKACNTVKTTITSPKYRRRVASRSAVTLADNLWCVLEFNAGWG